MKLTERDLQRIQQAVVETERKTRGEIVPVLLSHSRAYPETWWYLAAVGAIFSGFSSFSIHEFLGLGWSLSISQFCGYLAGGAFLGLVLGCLPGLRRLLVGRRRATEAVHLRALAEFTRHGVMNTADRCGVLLLISLFEHRAEIVADQGIHSRVNEDYWKQELDQMMREVSRSGLTEALSAGILRMGDKLALQFPRELGTTNDLEDHLR